MFIYIYICMYIECIYIFYYLPFLLFFFFYFYYFVDPLWGNCIYMMALVRGFSLLSKEREKSGHHQSQQDSACGDSSSSNLCKS